MKYYQIIALSLFTFLLNAFTINEIKEWKVIDDYKISFETKKASGSFETFTGEIFFDEHNLLESKCHLSIEVASIKTGNFLKNRQSLQSFF